MAMMMSGISALVKKALTLHQPWGSLVVDGHKMEETRSWPLPSFMQGQWLAIHAGKKVVPPERAPHGLWYPFHDTEGPLPTGAVLGLAKVDDIVQVYSPEHYKGVGELYVRCRSRISGRKFDVQSNAYGDFGMGRWLYLFSDVVKLDNPIPCRGRQMLWNLPVDVVDAIKEQGVTFGRDD